MNKERYKIIPYNKDYYIFPEIVGGVLIKLEELHHFVEGKYMKLFEVGKDSSTIFHDAFYNKYRAGWAEMELYYLNFIYEVIAPHFEEDFLYQKFPTFRVHLPDNIAVGRYHMDSEFGHPKGERNFIIPLTNSYDTASMWLESEPGKADFEPVPLEVGYLLAFNGNELTHGNEINKTGKTRVSMDFRILPISMYDESVNSESVTRKTKFIQGEYYNRFRHGE